MDRNERNEFLYSLIMNYCIEKTKSKVWQRGEDEGYLIAKGKLLGACMALDLDFTETSLCVVIKTRKGKELIRYEIN